MSSTPKNSVLASDMCNLNPDSIIQARIRDHTLQPKQCQSPSDFKPPTLNSSFLANPMPITEPVRVSGSARDSLLSRLQLDRQSQTQNNLDERQQENSESKYLLGRLSSKKQHSYFKQFGEFSSFLRKTESNFKIALQQKFVKRFLFNLFQRVYIYRKGEFSNLSEQIMVENYLTNPNDGHTLIVEEKTLQIRLQHWFVYVWNCIIILTFLLCYFVLPLSVGFSILELNDINLIIVLILVSDVILNFNKQQLVKDIVIKDRWTIFKLYVNTNFILDSITLFILILIIWSGSNVIINILLQITFYIVSYKKLLRSINELTENLDIPENVAYKFQLFCSIITLIFLSHFFACIWHQIGINQDQEDSWLYRVGLSQETIKDRYFNSLHWATAILMGIGTTNSLELSNLELILTTCLMYLSNILLAYILYQFYLYNTRIEKMDQQYQSKLTNINQFLNTHQIPLEMRARVRNYLNYYLTQDSKTRTDENSSFIGYLPEQLKKELQVMMRAQIVHNCKVLKRFSKSIHDEIIQHMELIRFQPGEQIIKKNVEDDRSLYIVESGEVMIYDYVGKKLNIYETLASSKTFGEWSFFSSQLRTASAKAVGFTRVYRIKQQDFLDCLMNSKRDKELFVLIQHQLLFYSQMNYAHLRCYGCNSQNHLINQCPQLNYKPDLERLIKIENFDQQIRMNYFRTNKKKINSLFHRLKYQELMKCFRQKNNMAIDDLIDPNEQDEIYSDELSESSSEMISSGGEQITITQGKDGTYDSILKKKENSQILREVESENDDEMFIIRSNGQKGTLGTAQFQFQLEPAGPSLPSRRILSTNEQSISNNTNFRLAISNPNNPIYTDNTKLKRTTSSLQISNDQPSSQIIANEGPIPSVKKIKNQAHLTYKNDQESHSSGQKQKTRTLKTVSSKLSIANVSEKTKQNLSKIREEDSDTLNLSNFKSQEDYQQSLRAGSPYYKGGNRMSMKRFSSKLSTIPYKSHTQYRSNLNLYQKSQIQQIMTNGLVDLSMYRRDNDNEEFETMCEFVIFYPVNNFRAVIARYNYFIRKKVVIPMNSKYSLYYYVKQIIFKLSCSEGLI